ncbi:MAG TPA: response regulator [Candidatus Binataceae bacterium]|jgi:CheY-like chemotaxis protein|nr:response regulator [Candidatus Binataceae bacterium]
MDDSSNSRPTGKTILIVDDELGVLEVLEYILKDLGYSVVSALNGRDALERVKENKPDLMMVDFMMPVMDGTALLQALRSDPDHCAIPVILTSALPEQTVREKASGYNVFLRKPYKSEKLLEAIKSLLGSGTDSNEP